MLGSDDALRLTADNANGLALSVPHAVEILHGAPFVGIARKSFKASMVEHAGAPAVRLAASFAGQLSIDILQTHVQDLQMTVSGAGWPASNPEAGTAVHPGPPPHGPVSHGRWPAASHRHARRSHAAHQAGVLCTGTGIDAQLDIQGNRTMTLRRFPFVELRSLAGSLTLNSRSMTVTGGTLRAEGRYVRTNISADVTYYAAHRTFGVVTTIPELGLQVGLASTLHFVRACGSSLALCARRLATWNAWVSLAIQGAS